MSTTVAPPAAGGLVRLLADDVIDRIAAGEVIERPASVVKELCENALDAGATTIEVHLEEGGLAGIVVSDDGAGMSPADAERSILRHATSKLASAEDLFDIRTLGFRGEALSSIAAVSRLTLTTRRPGDEAAVRLEVEGGRVLELGEVGAPVGTTVEVRELFFNTPARRKFMRSSATEQAHACEAALRVVLGAPGAGLTVATGERRLVDVPAGGAAAPRLAAALGPRVGQLYPFELESDAVRVRGVVTRPEVDRADAKGLWFFVNGRFVRDRMLQRALLDGYRSMVERGRYPVAVVYVDVAPAAVDVNVHPQKLEVRFGDPSLVFRAVSRALAGVLARTPWLPTGGLRAATSPYVPPRPGAGSVQESREPGRAWRPAGSPGTSSPQAPPAAPLELFGERASGYFASLRPVGQALGLFVVCEGQGELVLVDQHAAHERVAYETLRRARESGEVARQQLLFPEPLDVSPRQAAVLEEHGAELEAYGFEVELVGPARFAVRAVPAALAGADARALAHALVDEVCALEDAGLGLTARDSAARILSRCACHAVVRAGDALGGAELRALLVELDRVDFGAACPHGRPVYHRISRAELDRLFHRA